MKRGTVQQIKQDRVVEIYYPDAGQIIYERNRKNCVRPYRLLECETFIKHVVEEFHNKDLSLDAICGRALKTGAFSREEMVCTKTLYNYVDQGLLGIINLDLPLKVRCSTKPPRVREHKKQLGDSIDERPEHINDRSEFGHWEIDTVLGKKAGSEAALLTLTERMTRKEIIVKIPSKTVTAVHEALIDLVSIYGKESPAIFKSITSDNGSEFSALASLEKELKTKIYFAHPYSSCERGTNERHNGLIRRFIPKGKSLKGISSESIARVERWCNSLPRRILDYLTPDEAFSNQLALISTP